MDSKCLNWLFKLFCYVLILTFCKLTLVTSQNHSEEKLNILKLLSPQRVIRSLFSKEHILGKDIPCNVTTDCLESKHSECIDNKCQCTKDYPLQGPIDCYKGVHFGNNCTVNIECVDTGTTCVDYCCLCDYGHGYRQEDQHCQHPDFIIGVECAVFVFMVIFVGVFCRLKFISIRNNRAYLKSHHTREYRSSTITNPIPSEYVDEAERKQYHSASNASFGLSGGTNDQFRLSQKSIASSKYGDSSQKQSSKDLRLPIPQQQNKSQYNFDNPVFSELNISP